MTSVAVHYPTPSPGLPAFLGSITSDVSDQSFHPILPSPSPPRSYIHKAYLNSSIQALSSRSSNSGRPRHFSASTRSTASLHSDTSIRSTVSLSSNGVRCVGAWVEAANTACDGADGNTPPHGHPAVLNLSDFFSTGTTGKSSLSYCSFSFQHY